MINKHYLAAAMLVAGCLTLSSAAQAQRQDAQPALNQALPLCREAQAGERCRTRNGEVRIRGGQRTDAGDQAGQVNNLGGGDPGWEVRDPRPDAGAQTGQTNNLGGGDPGWEVRDPRPDAGAQTGQTNNLGGGDPGWEVRGPRPDAGTRTGQTNNLGGGDPGWEVHAECDTGAAGEQTALEGRPDVQNFGGADVGFVTGPGDKAPEAVATACE